MCSDPRQAEQIAGAKPLRGIHDGVALTDQVSYLEVRFLRRAGRTAIAPVLKTGARKGLGVRIPRSPLLHQPELQATITAVLQVTEKRFLVLPADFVLSD